MDPMDIDKDTNSKPESKNDNVPETDTKISASDYKKEKLVIGVFAEKGGTGKSSLAHSIAAMLSLNFLRSKPDYKILVIDADPQNNIASFNTNVSYVSRLNKLNIYDIVLGKIDTTRIHHNPISNYDLILGTDIPHNVQANLDSDFLGEMKNNINAVIKNIKTIQQNYQIVIIDFNPTFSALNKILLMCCDELICVYNCDPMCMQFGMKLKNELNRVNDHRKLSGFKDIKLKLCANMVRYKGPNMVKAHSNFIQSFERLLSTSSFVDVKTLPSVVRCECLSRAIRNKKLNQADKASYQGFKECIKELLYFLVVDKPYNIVNSDWDWKRIDDKNSINKTVLYVIEFKDNYKIGYSKKFDSRKETLDNLERVAKSGEKRRKSTGSILYLFESDEDSIYAVEQAIHFEFQRFNLEDTIGKEYYVKNNDLLVFLNKLSADKSFSFELSCSYLLD